MGTVDRGLVGTIPRKSPEPLGPDTQVEERSRMPSPMANAMMRFILASPLHPLLGPSFAVVSVEGRRTGRMRSTPVNAVRDGDTFTVLSMASRSWWRNLRGDRPATLLVSGKRYPVRGEVIEAVEQVSAALREHFIHNPGLACYFKVQLDADRR